MHGETSLASNKEVREDYSQALRDAGSQAGVIAEELFGFAAVLDSNGRLERALTDPGRSPEDKAKLAAAIVGGKVNPLTEQIVESLAKRRWSRVDHIANSVEDMAIDAILVKADSEQVTGRVAVELAKIHSAVLNLTVVRSCLSDTNASADNRVKVLQDVIFTNNDLHEITRTLAEHAARELRNRRFLSTVQWLIDKISEHAGEQVVTVTTAVELTAEQSSRIQQAYTLKLNCPVHINSVVDPTVIGGMRIQSGAEVTDTTVVAQLRNLQHAVA